MGGPGITTISLNTTSTKLTCQDSLDNQWIYMLLKVMKKAASRRTRTRLVDVETTDAGNGDGTVHNCQRMAPLPLVGGRQVLLFAH
jgi:hypothetical protein